MVVFGRTEESCCELCKNLNASIKTYMYSIHVLYYFISLLKHSDFSFTLHLKLMAVDSSSV